MLKATGNVKVDLSGGVVTLFGRTPFGLKDEGLEVPIVVLESLYLSVRTAALATHGVQVQTFAGAASPGAVTSPVPLAGHTGRGD